MRLPRRPALARRLSFLAPCLLLISLAAEPADFPLAAPLAAPLTPPLAPLSDSLLDKLEHRRWTAADAAPSQIGALAQTPDGHLWLGTHDSLYRFDGQRFTPHAVPDGGPPGIVSALLAGSTGLWVGLRGGGLMHLGAEGQQTHAVGGGLPQGVIYSIVEDRGGAIWAAANEGLARFDGRAWQRSGADWAFPGRQAYALFLDRDGTLWAANEDRLFYLPEGARAFVDSGIAVDQVSQITQAPDGAIWLSERYSGTVRRLLWRDGVLQSQERVIEGVQALLLDRGGHLWLGTSSAGVLHLPAPAERLFSTPDAAATMMAFSSTDGLSADAVRLLFEDADGNLWVGSSAGLDRFRPRSTVLAPFPQQALNVALAAGPEGSMLAGTSNLPAMRLSRGGLHQLDVPAPVQSAASGPDGAVWLAGSQGVWRVQGEGVQGEGVQGEGMEGDGRQAESVEHVAPSPVADEPDSAVRALTLDSAGRPWVSINRAGLFVLREGGWLRLTPPSEDPSQAMPVSASTAPSGRLWFGYRNNLIVTYDGYDGEEERHWGASDGLQVGHVTAMLHLDDSSWVGGQRGLARFDGSAFHPLQLPDNGLFDNIYAILATPGAAPQGGHDLWLHSRGGIFQLPAQELARASADPSHVIRYRSHAGMGGLANDPHQVLPLPTAVRGSDGRLWFSTSGGVIWIDPTRHARDFALPLPRIEAVRVDGLDLPVGQPLRLAPRPRRVEIDYSAPNLSGHDGLHFHYLLEGVDPDWQQVGAQRQAAYAQLAPGDYRFRLRASNPNGVLSAEEATLRFSIPQVFYRSPPFLLLCAAALAGLLWWLHGVKLRRAAEQLRTRLEERHAERERIARELHDTLLQGVHGLLLNCQAATDTLPPAHPARGGLEQALDRADRMLVEARDRVHELRCAQDSPLNLAAALGAFGRELQQESGAAFRLSSQGPAQALHPIVADESYRIGCEALLNAFRHARAGRVTLRLSHDRQAFRLSVEDDGRGIDAAALPSQAPPHAAPNAVQGHWGLQGMLERAGKIGGSLSIRPAPLHGTRIELSVPAAAAYPHGRQRLPWLTRLFSWRSR